VSEHITAESQVSVILPLPHPPTPCGPIAQPFRRKRSGIAVTDMANKREENMIFECIGGDC
jgi:hypothetical protein